MLILIFVYFFIYFLLEDEEIHIILGYPHSEIIYLNIKSNEENFFIQLYSVFLTLYLYAIFLIYESIILN
jgi:hypothetical protein